MKAFIKDILLAGVVFCIPVALLLAVVGVAGIGTPRMVAAEQETDRLKSELSNLTQQIQEERGYWVANRDTVRMLRNEIAYCRIVLRRT